MARGDLDDAESRALGKETCSVQNSGVLDPGALSVVDEPEVFRLGWELEARCRAGARGRGSESLRSRPLTSKRRPGLEGNSPHGIGRRWFRAGCCVPRQLNRSDSTSHQLPMTPNSGGSCKRGNSLKPDHFLGSSTGMHPRGSDLA